MSANTSTSYPAAMYSGFPTTAFGMLHHTSTQLLAANHQAAAAFMAAQLPMSTFASTLFPHHPALFGAWTTTPSNTTTSHHMSVNAAASPHSPPASPDSTIVDVIATTPAPAMMGNKHNFGTISPQHENMPAKKARMGMELNATMLTPCGPISPPQSSGSSPTNSTHDSTDESSGGSSKDASRTFTCKICSRSFGYKHVLQNHERTHTGEKPFECPECHKRFTRDHHLKTHMRLHTGEKPYHCTQCDRQFVQVANLRRHLRVHTGERPFTCEICDGKFSDTNQLKSHMLVHSNEKPFACDLCPMKFRRRHHLLNHKCGNQNSAPLTPAISPATTTTTTSFVDVQMCDQKSSYGSEDSFELAGATRRSSTVNMTSSASSEAPLDLSEDCSSSVEGGRSRKPHDIRRVFRLPPPQITHIPSAMPMQTEPEDLSMHTPRYYNSTQMDSSESMQHDHIDLDELDDAAALYMRQQQQQHLGTIRHNSYME